MKINSIITYNNSILRILDIQGTKALVIDCNKKSMPKWVDIDSLSCYIPRSDIAVSPALNLDNFEPQSRKVAYERFAIVSRILPFITDKRKRSLVIAEIAEEKNICPQTVCNYLWLFLSSQNIASLAPQIKTERKELSEVEKTMRWALNRFYYTQRKNTLTTAYTLMLKEKFCDETGQLLEDYPSINQFLYFYRKHKSAQNYFISRNGITDYQRNARPLLGGTIQDFAPAVGVGFMDSTLLDIYLVNEAKEVVGRPILTVCIDGFSSLCMGYALTFEGGIYSLRSLMLNIIADKQALCRKHGIKIDCSDWNCNMLPTTLISDRGKEYCCETFENLSDLGISITNLAPYRAELKGNVERFFETIQALYKPHLFGKGVIMPDFAQRGAKDYRKTATLTLEQFEKVILRCIAHYNTSKIIENYPFTSEMLESGVKPYSSSIWNYGLKQVGATLIPVDYETLALTLLPRAKGKFTRKGLVVNGIRYKHESGNYTERYLNGGEAVVSYNPENVDTVWLFEHGKYAVFHLIESRFKGKSIDAVHLLTEQQKAINAAEKHAILQSKIDVIGHINAIAENTATTGNVSIKNIRQNRKREQQRAHIDFIGVTPDE